MFLFLQELSKIIKMAQRKEKEAKVILQSVSRLPCKVGNLARNCGNIAGYWSVASNLVVGKKPHQSEILPVKANKWGYVKC